MLLLVCVCMCVSLSDKIKSWLFFVDWTIQKAAITTCIQSRYKCYKCSSNTIKISRISPTIEQFLSYECEMSEFTIQMVETWLWAYCKLNLEHSINFSENLNLSFKCSKRMRTFKQHFSNIIIAYSTVQSTIQNHNLRSHWW